MDREDLHYPIAPVRIKYGTSGLRDVATHLPGAVYRLGILVADRAAHAGAAWCVVITASHNPPHDNGAKILTGDGNMLPAALEPLVENVVNTADLPDPSTLKTGGVVLIACDTRESSPALVDACVAGVARASGVPVVVGALHTPAAHWLVAHWNESPTPPAAGPPVRLSSVAAGVPRPSDLLARASAAAGGMVGAAACPRAAKVAALESRYYEQLCNFGAALAGAPSVGTALVVDCANGVGALALGRLARLLPHLTAVCGDTANPALLNVNCGADFVKTTSRIPTLVPPAVGERYASLDGDADRLVFWVPAAAAAAGAGAPAVAGEAAVVLDGDCIGALIAAAIHTSLTALALCPLWAEVWGTDPAGPPRGVCYVHTAYTNGATVAALAARGFALEATPTGVKHLSAAAARQHVAVWFEANGHGTPHFSPRFARATADYIALAAALPGVPAERVVAAQRLYAYVRLAGVACGDAVGGLVMVEATLRATGVTTAEWVALCPRYPAVLAAVPRTAGDTPVVTSPGYGSDPVVLSPPALREALASAVARARCTGGFARAFVRASGTEPTVRVYAEADDAATARALADEVCAAVREC